MWFGRFEYFRYTTDGTVLLKHTNTSIADEWCIFIYYWPPLPPLPPSLPFQLYFVFSPFCYLVRLASNLINGRTAVIATNVVIMQMFFIQSQKYNSHCFLFCFNTFDFVTHTHTQPKIRHEARRRERDRELKCVAKSNGACFVAMAAKIWLHSIKI